MFMRFVDLHIDPGSASAFVRFYEHRIGPVLRQVDGCQFATLIHSTDSDTEFMSFTLWKSAEHALAYEQSGAYKSLLAENEPFEAQSTEWKIQLTEDNTLEYKPVREDPVVQAMPVIAGTAEEQATSSISSDKYVRILHANVQPGKFQALSKVYDEEIVPMLLEQDGCRGAYLIGNEGSDDGLSVTIWDSQDQARAYEDSGMFAVLLDKAAPLLSSMYQWKMTLSPDQRDHIRTSEDVTVRGFTVVTGKQV